MTEQQLQRDAKGIVLGNVYDKYATRNPIARWLLKGYMRDLSELLNLVEAPWILEIGCGEGHLARILQSWYPSSKVYGIDLSPDLFAGPASSSSPKFLAQSAYHLGFAERSFDLVVGAEVLEHLDNPSAALAEMRRVARRYVVLSVPREPVWRCLNMARLTYLPEWGNTPGHFQHWSKAAFLALVRSELRILRVRNPLPWTMVLAERV